MVEGKDHISRRRLVVGCDLDGVLGDQIPGVIPRIKERFGIELVPEAVTEFRLRLGTSDLGYEIELAQREDEEYLAKMPVHDGAVELIRDLRTNYRVLLITARPTSSRRATQAWLAAHHLEFDGVINAREAAKSVYGVDVLIDDYVGNIEDFLARTPGDAVLVDRPWNRNDRGRVQRWIPDGRLHVAERLADVIPIVTRVDRRKSAAQA